MEARSAALIRDARKRAGLSQTELAGRAGTTQSVISAYESSARQPSLPTLARLIRAAGVELELRLAEAPVADTDAQSVRSRVHQLRRQIRAIARNYGITDVRLFGSVARGDSDSPGDIDLLVTMSPNVSLVDLARCERDLEKLLGHKVDLVPASDLKAGVAALVLREATRL